jgi:hypothetical protein
MLNRVADLTTAQMAVMKFQLKSSAKWSGPNGNRTRVTDVRGRCPRPLDDGTVLGVGQPLSSKRAMSRVGLARLIDGRAAKTAATLLS